MLVRDARLDSIVPAAAGAFPLPRSAEREP